MTANDERPVINICPDMLPITLEVYARRTEQTVKSVQKQADRGDLPIIQGKKGGTRYVNQAKLIMTSLEAADWTVQTPSDLYSV